MARSEKAARVEVACHSNVTWIESSNGRRELRSEKLAADGGIARDSGHCVFPVSGASIDRRMEAKNVSGGFLLDGLDDTGDVRRTLPYARVGEIRRPYAYLDEASFLSFLKIPPVDSLLFSLAGCHAKRFIAHDLHCKWFVVSHGMERIVVLQTGQNSFPQGSHRRPSQSLPKVRLKYDRGGRSPFSGC